MKELVEVIAKSLVDIPEQVSVQEIEADGATIYELSVSEEDMGKIIGRQGRTVKALRTVVNAAALKDDKKVSIEIV